LALYCYTSRLQVDAQLAEVEGYKERAAAAVEKGNNVLTDARNTLTTLESELHFNQSIQMKK